MYKEKFLKYKNKYLELKKQFGGSNNIEEYIKHDPRILDFRKEIVVLPEKFIQDKKKNKNMLLACGDGDYITTNSNVFSRGLDLRDYYKRHTIEYNIFCCKYDYNIDGLQSNIKYLSYHPEKNIILCLFDSKNPDHLQKLTYLFNNFLDSIGTDDLRYFINSEDAYLMLKKGGKVYIGLDNPYIDTGYKNINKFQEIKFRELIKI
jgi:hypothetical protein